MIGTSSTQPVVVGVDGSKHALHAAAWASDEAVGRDTSLRLVYVIASEVHDIDVQSNHARLALQAALTTVEETGHPVRMESEILRGDPAAVLIEESRAARIMCVGARGAHDSAAGRRGGTAAALAVSAFCPVAVIRRRHPHRRVPHDGRIVVVLDESPVSRAVWRIALDEARRRDVPLLALTSWPVRARGLRAADAGRGVREEFERYLHDIDTAAADTDAVDVEVCALPLPPNVTGVLAQSADVDQLIIVGKNDPALIAELVGPQGRSLLRKTNCSVMIFRGQLDRMQQGTPQRGIPVAEASIAPASVVAAAARVPDRRGDR